MIIDTHAHYLPQCTVDTLTGGARQFPNVAATAEGDSARLSFGGGKPTRPIMGNLRGTAHRLQFMDEQGLQRQIVGGWLDSFGYELEAEEGADWSRFLNEDMLAATAAHERLIPLATVPMQDGELAAAVLREAIGRGCHGAMIGTQPKGGHGNLDDPGLDPFWAAAAELEAAILIHPMFGSDDDRLHDMGMMNAVGRVTDVTIAISRLLFSGHLLRFPGLRIVATTGGGALPFMLGRLSRNHAIDADNLADPVEGLRRLYFDSIVFRPQALRFLSELVGTERIMLGSDYPFPIGDITPTKVIHDAGYNEAETAAMLGGTAATLFRL
jgi:aminocarboxymuconate-semialdehyde decarboxylase